MCVCVCEQLNVSKKLNLTDIFFDTMTGRHFRQNLKTPLRLSLFVISGWDSVAQYSPSMV